MVGFEEEEVNLSLEATMYTEKNFRTKKAVKEAIKVR